jgi:ELWxxDGT repeat protein
MRASWKGQIQLWILMAGLMAGLTAAVQTPAAAQPAFRVADLNVDGPTDSFLASGQTSDLVEHQGDVYLAGSDGLYGVEPWRIDGTGGSPPEVMDICPGACSSQASDFTAVGSALFFVADDGAHGRELWVRDAGGTRLVADLVPGLDSSTPLHLAELGGKLVFNASALTHSRELWESDGTAAGTRLLANVSTMAESNPIPLGVAGSRLLFAADDGVHGQELWATDGTTAGTALVADICPGISGSLGSATLVPDAPIAVVAGGRLFFSALDCVHGTELWVSDGTPAGTHWIGSGGSAPAGLAALGSQVFFRAFDDTHGLELWVSDGTAAGTHLVIDLRAGFQPGQPLEITAFGDRVYFHATNGLGGRRLWASDGTAAGTVLISTAAGFHEILLAGLTVVGSRLIFFADDGVHGSEPWASDGTAAGTVPLGDFRPGADSFFDWGIFVAPDHRAAAGGRLYFRANDGVSGDEIWSTDGTAAGTRMEGDLNTQTSSFAVQHGGGLGLVRPFGALAGEVLFPAGDGRSRLVPWKSDGSAAGTLALADLLPPPSTLSPSPQQLTGFGDLALFAGPAGFTGSSLWRTDGTPAGTFSLAEDPEHSGGALSELTRLGDRLLFVQEGALQVTDGTVDGTTTLLAAGAFPAALTPFPAAGKVLLRANAPGLGQELWASDGTVAGTQPIKDLLPGGGSSFPGALAAAGPLVFFAAQADDAGRELWASDGTAAGTRRVKDISPGANPGIPFSSNLVALGPVVLFAAGDVITGIELWRSDGTAAGTVLLRDIFPGQRSSEIRSLVAAGTRVFFVADDGVHGRELWTSDGTAAGTGLVEDILPGPGSSVPRELAVADDLLLFAAHDGVHGVEPWASNGTAAGTFRIQDIAPGPLPSSPLAFHPAGPNVYFAATDADTGFELWALPRAGLSRFGDVPPSHWAWGFVEALAAAGITSGCGNGNFCPGAPVSRAQMAVFLVLAVHGAGFVPPPATGTLFSDVPAGAFAAAFIEQLAADGITSGCATAPLRFCPGVTVNRAQMAVFLLLAKHGPGYTPPTGTGAVFGDVGPDHWARDWIEQLAAEGITGGCGGGLFCPSRPLTRAEMAVFLTGALDLLP